MLIIRVPNSIFHKHGLLDTRTGNFKSTVNNVKIDVLISEQIDEITSTLHWNEGLYVLYRYLKTEIPNPKTKPPARAFTWFWKHEILSFSLITQRVLSIFKICLSNLADILKAYKMVVKNFRQKNFLRSKTQKNWFFRYIDHIFSYNSSLMKKFSQKIF